MVYFKTQKQHSSTLAGELVLITPSASHRPPLLEQCSQPRWEYCPKQVWPCALSWRKKLCFSECLLGTSMLKSLQQGAQCLGQARGQNVRSVYTRDYYRLRVEEVGKGEGVHETCFLNTSVYCAGTDECPQRSFLMPTPTPT